MTDNKNRVGYYCWAGPDTVRMIELKFFKPKIDRESVMSSYEYDYIAQVKEKIGVTDFWATYSWGFSNESEFEQRKFLEERINNFRRAGVKLHAYVQGPNLVYKDFKGQDLFARDEKGRLITYYRGRKVACINNPYFLDYKLKLIEEMCQKDFDGIFMDNIQMGQIPIPASKGELPFTFAGCNCKYCQEKFRQVSGQKIPKNLRRNPELTKDYLEFRTGSVNEFLSKIYSITSKNNKEFGTNSFDPKFDTELLFGVRIEDIASRQDYLLFENHSLPGKKHGNYYIHNLAKSKGINKPIFVVSYKKGIGLDSEFDQVDLNNIFTEDQKLSFSACYKGSEYVTEGVWHNLRIESFEKLKPAEAFKLRKIVLKKQIARAIGKYRLARFLIRQIYNPFFTMYMERSFVRKLLARFSTNLVT